MLKAQWGLKANPNWNIDEVQEKVYRDLKVNVIGNQVYKTKHKEPKLENKAKGKVYYRMGLHEEYAKLWNYCEESWGQTKGQRLLWQLLKMMIETMAPFR